jgi:hypothetical protein
VLEKREDGDEVVEVGLRIQVKWVIVGIRKEIF